MPFSWEWERSECGAAHGAQPTPLRAVLNHINENKIHPISFTLLFPHGHLTAETFGLKHTHTHWAFQVYIKLLKKPMSLPEPIDKSHTNFTSLPLKKEMS